MTSNAYKCKKLQRIYSEELAQEFCSSREIISALVEARLQKNMTQKQLAQITGIQQAHISRLESGKYNPSLRFLSRIAEGLGMELHITLR